ncbi:hypothetical protein ACHAWX_000111 [Stephanocyclus meneghinianus]
MTTHTQSTAGFKRSTHSSLSIAKATLTSLNKPRPPSANKGGPSKATKNSTKAPDPANDDECLIS